MPLSQQAIIDQIDTVLQECEALGQHDLGSETFGARRALLVAAIERLAPPGSAYHEEAKGVPRSQHPHSQLSAIIGELTGILRAIRADYAADRLRSIEELIHADTFSDFLEMARYLVAEGYKDPAAVLAGGTLEGHLRALCNRHGIAITTAEGKPMSAGSLNVELARNKVYSLSDQQSVTAWLAHRNSAAHGKYDAYTQEQVALLVDSVRDFLNRHPA